MVLPPSRLTTKMPKSFTICTMPSRMPRRSRDNSRECWWIMRCGRLLAIWGMCVKRRNGLWYKPRSSSGWFLRVLSDKKHCVGLSYSQRDWVAFPSTILPAMPDDDHSIAINIGVYNTLDAKVCTTSVAGFEAFKLQLQPLIDCTTSANSKDNGRHVWWIWSARPVFRACKLSTDSHVVQSVAPDTDWTRVLLRNSPTLFKLQTWNN